jgi:hypothetical protein
MHRALMVLLGLPGDKCGWSDRDRRRLGGKEEYPSMIAGPRRCSPGKPGGP